MALNPVFTGVQEQQLKEKEMKRERKRGGR